MKHNEFSRAAGKKRLGTQCCPSAGIPPPPLRERPRSEMCGGRAQGTRCVTKRFPCGPKAPSRPTAAAKEHTIGQTRAATTGPLVNAPRPSACTEFPALYFPNSSPEGRQNRLDLGGYQNSSCRSSGLQPSSCISDARAWCPRRKLRRISTVSTSSRNKSI